MAGHSESLTTAELLMLQAFNDALAELATLDSIAGAVSLDAAVRNLSTLVAQSLSGSRASSRRDDRGRLADPCVIYDGHLGDRCCHAAAWPGPARARSASSLSSLANCCRHSRGERCGNAQTGPKHHPQHSCWGATRDRELASARRGCGCGNQSIARIAACIDIAGVRAP